MKITKEIVDRDYENLQELYNSVRKQFANFPKWYVSGRLWMRDVENKKNIDDSFGKLALLDEEFLDKYAPIAEWLLLSVGRQIRPEKYDARINSSLDTLVQIEETCRLIQKREELLGVFSTYASRK